MATNNKKQQETTTPQVEARIDRLLDGDYKTKAFASATIGGAFAIHGLRVIESDEGRFISMPQESYTRNGKTKVVDRLCEAICSLSPERITSITCRSWIVKAFN